MNRTLLFAAALAGAVLVPQLASADAMSSHDTMAGPAMSGPMWVCHAAKTNEKSNAMTTDKTPLACKSMDMHKMMAGPDMSQAKSATDADKAWRDFLAVQMNTR